MLGRGWAGRVQSLCKCASKIVLSYSECITRHDAAPNKVLQQGRDKTARHCAQK